jgi:hypothetical protein
VRRFKGKEKDSSAPGESHDSQYRGPPLRRQEVGAHRYSAQPPLLLFITDIDLNENTGRRPDLSCALASSDQRGPVDQWMTSNNATALSLT